MPFQKSTLSQGFARIANTGPAKSGKTWNSLAIGTRLGKRVAVIDSERGSASKYAKDFDFDVLELDGNFSPQKYIDAIDEAAAAGYDVLIIDSISHAWASTGGALEMHDKATIRSGNSFTAWGDVTPLQNKFIDAMLQYPGHLIVTMRTKTEYVIETNSKGKQVPKKIGLSPVQRAGVEYEFDVVAELDVDHHYVVSGSRCKALNGFVGEGENVGRDVADILSGWLSDGTPRGGSPTEPEGPEMPPAPPTEDHPAVKAATDAGFEKVPLSKEDEIAIKESCLIRADAITTFAENGDMPKPKADTRKGLAMAIYQGLGDLDGKLLDQTIARVGAADVDPDGIVVVPK